MVAKFLSAKLVAKFINHSPTIINRFVLAVCFGGFLTLHGNDVQANASNSFTEINQHVARKQYGEAIEKSRAHLALLQGNEPETESDRAHLFLTIGKSFEALSDLPMAQSAFEVTLRIAERNLDAGTRFSGWTSPIQIYEDNVLALGRVLSKQNQFEQAHVRYLKYIELAKGPKFADRKGFIQGYRALAGLFMLQKKYSEAEYWVEQSLNFWAESQRKSNARKTNFNTSTPEAWRAIAKTLEDLYDTQPAIDLQDFGAIKAARGDLVNAEKFYLEAYVILQKDFAKATQEYGGPWGSGAGTQIRLIKVLERLAAVASLGKDETKHQGYLLRADQISALFVGPSGKYHTSYFNLEWDPMEVRTQSFAPTAVSSTDSSKVVKSFARFCKDSEGDPKKLVALLKELNPSEYLSVKLDQEPSEKDVKPVYVVAIFPLLKARVSAHIRVTYREGEPVLACGIAGHFSDLDRSGSEIVKELGITEHPKNITNEFNAGKPNHRFFFGEPIALNSSTKFLAVSRWYVITDTGGHLYFTIEPTY